MAVSNELLLKALLKLVVMQGTHIKVLTGIVLREQETRDALYDQLRELWANQNPAFVDKLALALEKALEEKPFEEIDLTWWLWPDDKAEGDAPNGRFGLPPKES